MPGPHERALVAMELRHATEHLAKAAELADEFGLAKLATQLIDATIDLTYRRRELLELPRQTASTAEKQDQAAAEDVPF